MRSLQEGVVERAARVPDDRVQRRRQAQVTERAPGPEIRQHFGEPRRLHGGGPLRGQAIRHAARWLAHREAHGQRQQDAGQTDEDEGVAPSQGLVAPTAHERTERGADRHGQRVGGERGAAPAAGKVVGDERMRRRAAAGFADRGADTGGKEHREVHRQAAERRHAAPGGHRERQHVHPAPPVGERRDRDAENGIEEGERDAAQQSELKVGRAELRLDRLERGRENLRPVHHVDDVADCQRQQDIAPVPGLAQQPFGRRGGGGWGDGRRGGHGR